MRDFFKQTLSELKAMTGSRQVEYLSQEELTKMLDKLCSISNQFAYIPEAKQQAEVEKQIIEDQDFKELNPKIFYKWMYKISPLYWNATRMSEQDLTPQEPILEGEQRDYWLNEWRKALDQMQTNFTEAGKGSGSKLKEALDELAKKP